MSNHTPIAAAEQSNGPEVRAHIRDAEIEQFGRHGFETDLRTIAEAAGVSLELVAGQFGSAEGMRKACDNYILESIRTSKSDSLQSISPANWFAQIAQIDSHAPTMTYLVRSMESGGELGHSLMQRMIDNAEGHLEDAVRAGTIKPSRDANARTEFLALSGGGGFLLYPHLHHNPTDMAAVLRDYGKDMILPALDLYTHGLMTDSTIYDAFLAQEASAGHPRADASARS